MVVGGTEGIGAFTGRFHPSSLASSCSVKIFEDDMFSEKLQRGMVSGGEGQDTLLFSDSSNKIRTCPNRGPQEWIEGYELGRGLFNRATEGSWEVGRGGMGGRRSTEPRLSKQSKNP